MRTDVLHSRLVDILSNRFIPIERMTPHGMVCYPPVEKTPQQLADEIIDLLTPAYRSGTLDP